MSKQEMTQKTAEVRCMMLYEAVEFICKFALGLGRKKGVVHGVDCQ